MKRFCGVSGCRRNHNKLLHEFQQVPPAPVSVQQVLSYAKTCGGFLFKLVPTKIMGLNGQLKIFALVNEGSSITILDAKIASQLGLKGKKQHLTMQWYDEEKVTQNSTVVNVNIKGEAGEQYQVKNVYVIANLSLPTQSFEKSDYEHLNCLPIEDYDDVRPLMLLCLNCANVNASSTSVTAGASDPVAIRTKLGWVPYGQTGSSITVHSLMLFARAESSFKCLDRTVSEYFKCKNFGIENPTLCLESADDLRARKILSDTTRRINNRYEIGLLWRKNSPILPDSYAMTPKVTPGNSQDEIENITKPLWYPPHFSVQNPHKPDKFGTVFDAAATVDKQSLNSALLKGPEKAKPLIEKLFQLHQGRIAVAADIKEMFSQVKIRPADQNAQRFL
ncbi:uncharacterized protein LOC119665679 [Teleopsis dalmanni]|uniref:uncharacterized protein LOC119665679 n=1 Tax=Teleopsis dalmanni TaxID=139649 RepID=UPI0018CDEEEE|nr:uncharacterized protein LOC119665679 [Teleopsis dalmanni]